MNENSNTQNQETLFDLIQSIQSKMDTKNEDITIKQNSNNFINNEDNDKTTNKEKFYFSSILNNFDLSNILNMFNQNNTNNTQSNNFNLNNLDPNTLLKFQKIISNFNKNDPKKDLLKSLKPFLRKSRQDKIGEYINILSIINAIDIFGSKGSD